MMLPTILVTMCMRESSSCYFSCIFIPNSYAIFWK